MAYTTSLFIIFSIAVVGISPYPLDSKRENDTAKESFRPVSLPTDFGSYDPNANGYIDLEELAQVTGTTLDDARKPFMDADIDDDDQVSPAEFERAPWSLSALNREEIISEEDSDDDEEEQVDDGDDDEEEVPVGDNDDESEDEEETPVDDNAEERAPSEESDGMDEVDDGSDDEEESVFDNADDILVDVAKSTAEDDDDGEKFSMVKLNDDVKEPSEEYDESRDIESSEEDIGEEDGQVDPLLVEDHLSKQQDVIAENEFVENAIF